MADTVQITAGSGISVSTDELSIDGVLQHVQRFKLGLGANNAWDMDLDSGQQTMANSLPVVIASNQSILTTSGIFEASIRSNLNSIGANIIYGSYTGAGTEAGVLRVTLANDSTGLLSVDDNGSSLTVDNGGTFAVQVDGAALTALQTLDNIVSGTGANISQINGVTPLMGNGATGTGSLRVTVASDNTAIPVLTHAVTQSGIWNHNIYQINGVTPLMGNGATGTGSLRVTVANDNTAIPINVSQMNGTTVTMGNGAAGTGVQRVTIASDSTGQVNSMGNIVDNAGFTDATTRLQMSGYIFDDVAGTALTENDAAAARVDSKRAQMFVMEDATTRGQKATVTTRGSQLLEGAIAHNAALTANPVAIGGYATTVEASGVHNGDVVQFVSDITGKQIILPYANPENFISGTTASGIVNTSDRQIIAAQGGSLRIYVTSLLVTNAHASVGTVVNIKDGSTVIHRGYAAANGGGFSMTFPVALKLTANSALNAACVTTGSSVEVSAAGYKGV